MFLSQLNLDVRDRRVRRDLGNGYELHRTLMRAFPDAAAGGPGRVLHRLDADHPGRPAVLVQSARHPDWDRVEGGYRCVGVKELPAAWEAGRAYRFRLRANPTKRLPVPAGGGGCGKRVGLVAEADQLAWLGRKAAAAGFRVAGVRAVPEAGGYAAKGGARLTLAAVRFDGVLVVTDPAAFAAAVAGGVGSAKGFGFGLLSLAPAGG